MKIDSLLNKPVSAQSGESQASSAEARAKAGTAVQPEQSQEASIKDTVSLSDRSRLIAKATEIAQASPEVRAEKVAEIQERLQSGNYNVSGRTVAESMIKKGFLV